MTSPSTVNQFAMRLITSSYLFSSVYVNPVCRVCPFASGKLFLEMINNESLGEEQICSLAATDPADPLAMYVQ